MVSVEFEGKTLSSKHICDSPEVPPWLAESNLPTLKITDAEFAATNSVYRNAEAAGLVDLKKSSESLFDTSSEPGKTFQSNEEEWRTSMLSYLIDAEKQLMASTSASGDDFGSKWATSIVDSAREAAALLAVDVHLVYEGGGANAADATRYTEAAVAAIVQVVVGAATQAQYNAFETEGNIISNGFQEIAQCVAKYVEEHHEEMSEYSYIADHILSMVDEDINELVGMVEQPSQCGGTPECYGLSCYGLESGKQAIWDALITGITPIDANGVPHPDFCVAGATYTTAVLLSLANPAAGLVDEPIDGLAKAHVDKGMAEALNLDFPPADGILSVTEAYAAAMLAAETASAPEGMKLMAENTINSLTQGLIDISMITNEDFIRGGQIGIMANSQAQSNGMSGTNAEMLTAAEITFHLCHKIDPINWTLEKKDALITAASAVALAGYEALLAKPDSSDAALQLAVMLPTMTAFAAPGENLFGAMGTLETCFKGAQGYGLALIDENVGLPAFQTEFRTAIGLPAVEGAEEEVDKFAFQSIVDIFTVEAYLLQIVGLGVQDPTDPCNSLDHDHDALIATVDADRLLADTTTLSAAEIDAKLKATEAIITNVVACTATAMTSIGAAVGSEHAFRGKPNQRGIQQTPAHFTTDYWSEATVGHTARPLPNTWGIDRFPCGRATGLDIFREGDFVRC
jgi:hypothetical protein